MKRIRFIKLLSIIIVLATSCIEPYNPPEVEQAERYLVVDGYVDKISGNASIVLSRTKNLSESNAILPQINAQVRIEVESGQTYFLNDLGTGDYVAEGIFLSASDRCKLVIRSDGKEYESELVGAKDTPEIDSITYVADETGVRVDVTTHDPTNSTGYYQWKFEETVKYRSAFYSGYIYVDGEYEMRTAANDIYYCWKTEPSTTILVSSSAGLSEDVIYKRTLTFLPSTSWKIENRYSILVKQFAIDEETYNYWIQLMKNTETVGSLFDPQPSQITGNLRCISNPLEPIIGYFSVRSIKEKRLYIDASELPKYTNIINGYESCSPYEMDSLLFADYPDGPPFGSLLVSAVNATGGPGIIGYTTHSSSCIDCRLVRNGSVDEPDWWEE